MNRYWQENSKATSVNILELLRQNICSSATNGKRSEYQMLCSHLHWHFINSRIIFKHCLDGLNCVLELQLPGAVQEWGRSHEASTPGRREAEPPAQAAVAMVALPATGLGGMDSSTHPGFPMGTPGTGKMNTEGTSSPHKVGFIPHHLLWATFS